MKPSSDGSKKPIERTIGTSRTAYTSLCPNTEFEVTEELASTNSLHGTIGQDIFKEVEKMLTQYNLQWNQLKCVTTDARRVERGKD